MRGSLWSLVLVAIGGGLLIRGAGAAVPDSPASSTSDLATVFDQLAPFLGELLMLVAVGWLVIVAFKIQ